MGKDSPQSYQATVTGGFSLASHYVSADVKRTRISLVLGISTVAVVVTSLVFLQSLVESVVPLVFMRLAEQSVSESDLVMRPEGSGLFMNSTAVGISLQANSQVEGTTPRWALPVRAVSRTNANLTLEAYLLVIDSKQEDKIQLGRAYPGRILNEQEAYMSTAIVRRLGVEGNVGDRIYVDVDLTQLGSAFGASGLGLLTSNLTSLGVNGSTLISDQLSQVIAGLIGVNLTQTYSVDPFNGGTLDPIRTALENLNISTTTIDSLESQGVSVTGQQIVDVVAQSIGLGSGLNITAITSLRMEVIVLCDTEDGRGKWPDVMGNVIAVDSRYLSTLMDNVVYHTPQLRALQAILQVAASGLAGGIDPFKPPQVQEVLDRPGDYAFLVTVQNRDRIKAYTKSPQNMQQDVISFANSVYTTLGINFLGDNYAPVAEYLLNMEFLVIMFGQSFIIIDVVLILLGCILVFTLMLDTVSEKAYEYGMLQALGMLRATLAKLLLVQSAVYAIPATIFGVFVGWVLFSLIAQIAIAPFASVSYPSEVPFPTSAVLLGACVGLFMPFAANVVPIQQAISSTLRDALDLSHQQFSETKVRTIRLQQLQLRPVELGIGCAFLLIGFLSYYMFPLAMVYQLWELAFGILTIILITMVIGLAFVASSLQPNLEALVCFLMVRFKDAQLRPLVQRNLVSHRKRSYKTAVLVTLSFSFLVFASVLRLSQFGMITDTLKVFFGSDMRVMAQSTEYPLDRDGLTAILIEDMQQPGGGIVESYAFSTYPLRQTDTVTETIETNLADYPDVSVELIGVDPNLLSVLTGEFVVVEETDPEFSYKTVHGNPDVVRSLYDDSGKAATNLNSLAILTAPTYGLATDPSGNDNTGQLSQQDVQDMVDRLNGDYLDCIVSLSVQKLIALNTRTFHQIRNKARKENTATQTQATRSRLVRPRAVLSKLPGFSFSSYKTTARFGWASMVVTLDSFTSVLREMHNATVANTGDENVALEEVKFRDLFVRIKSGAKPEDIDALGDTLKTTFKSSNTRVLKLRNVLTTIDNVSNFVALLFYLTILIAAFLCFFSLFLSMYGNVRENSWEYGVLRALGVSSLGLQRAYVYEALCVILAAVANGTVVGTIIAVVLSVFTTVWTELPLKMEFPTDVFFVMFFLAIGVALLGTWIPTRAMNKLSIANVIRGTQS